MARVIWDDVTKKIWETGVDRCVLYKPDTTGKYTKGVGWNGLSAVNESPSGADTTKIYANNAVYGSMTAAEEYSGTIEAYTFPDEFRECDGSAEIAPGVYIGQQARKTFGLTYRTLLGNDTEDVEYGYKLHLVYGCKASPSSKDHATVNESPEAVTMSWEFSSTPVPVTGHKPTSKIEIVSTTVDKTKLAALEDILYGTAETEPRLPLPDEIITLLGATVEG